MTNQVVLREWKSNQEGGLVFFGLAQDPEVTKYLRLVQDLADATKWVAEQGHNCLAIEVDSKPIGVVTLRDSREIGYVLERRHWGRGFATQAVKLLLEQLKGREVIAYCHPDNIASHKVLLKNGFQQSLIPVPGQNRLAFSKMI